MNDLKFTTAGDYVDSMSTVIDNLMYTSGLTAQGCWDEFDDYQRGAVLRFAQLIIKECGKSLVENTPVVELVEEWDKGYDRAMNDCIHLIYEHFGIEE